MLTVALHNLEEHLPIEDALPVSHRTHQFDLDTVDALVPALGDFDLQSPFAFGALDRITGTIHLARSEGIGREHADLHREVGNFFMTGDSETAPIPRSRMLRRRVVVLMFDYPRAAAPSIAARRAPSPVILKLPGGAADESDAGTPPFPVGALNLLDEDVQYHVFGDIAKRSVVLQGERRLLAGEARTGHSFRSRAHPAASLTASTAGRILPANEHDHRQTCG